MNLYRITILLISFQVISLLSFSQEEIWGYHSLAGSEGGGMVFKVDPESKEVETIHRFGHGLDNIRTPDNPTFMNNGNGKLYGMAYKYAQGSGRDLYSYDPLSHEIELLVRMNEHVQFSAIESNYIYISKVDNGRNTIVYAYDIAENTFSEILTIPLLYGNLYQGQWLKVGEGIYQTLAFNGGTHESGTLVEIDLNTLSSEVLIEFKDDKFPVGSLVKTSDDITYGSLSRGSVHNFGCIFSIDPKKKEEYNVEAAFNDSTGGVPYGEMILANDGCFYGATASRGRYLNGTFYKFNPITDSLESIYHIDDNSEEFFQHTFSGYFTQIEDDQLIGVLENEIDSAAGKIFSFNLINHELEILYEFEGGEMLLPKGKLCKYDNKLLGIYKDDTVFNKGGIFNFDLNTMQCNSEKNFYIYDYAENGQNPNWMCQGANGHLYGMTAYGGKENKGVVFEINYYTRDFSKLMDVADIGFPINPKAECFLMGEDVIIGMSFMWSDETSLFEYNYKTNTFKKLSIIPNNTGSRLFLRKNMDGNLYLGIRGMFYEYNYPTNNLMTTTFPDSIDSRDIFEYSHNIYIGSSRIGGSETKGDDNGMLFKWNKTSGDIERIFDMSRLNPSGHNPNRPIYSLFCSSNGIVYGDYIYGESNKPSWSVSYTFDFPNDTLLNTRPFRIKKNNHHRNSLVESLDGKYIIKNYCETDEIIGAIDIYEEVIDSLYSLDLETSPFYYVYEGDDWDDEYYSDAPFDYVDRVDIINVIKPGGHKFWTGNIDSAWYNEENWYLNREPNEESNVSMINHRPNYPVLDTFVQVQDIFIQNKAQLTLNQFASLTCNELVNHGEITLYANNSARASFINTEPIINKGRINYSYRAKDSESVSLGIPISHLKIEDLGLAVSSFTNNSWTPLDSTEVLMPTNAYQFNLDSLAELQFIGELNEGNYHHPFNLGSINLEPISNPYPSSLDWRQLDLSNIRHKALYKFDAQDSTFLSYIHGLGDASPLILPLEVFWLNTMSSDQFTVDHQNRIHAKDFEDDITINPELVIKVEGQNASNRTHIGFNQNATAGFDPEFDALKNFFLPITPPQVFTFGGDERLDINQLPDTAMMDLAVNSRQEGNYTLSIDKSQGFDFVVLEDLIWKKRIDLLQQDYSFDYFTSDGDYPFKLYFKPWALEPVEDADIQIYYYPESIVVRSRKQIDYAKIIFYDLAGRVALQINAEDFHHFEKPISLPVGHYIVQVRTGDLVVNRKVLVRR